MDSWDKCANPVQDLTVFRSVTCYIGIDASEVDDLFAICILFVKDDGSLYAAYEVYCPSATIKLKANRGARYYEVWHKEGHIMACGEKMIDENFIAARVVKLCNLFRPRWIIVDQFAGATRIASIIKEWEIRNILRRLRKTAATVTESCKDIEARIKTQQGFEHDGNPAVRWCVSNTYVRRFVDESLIPQKPSEKSDKKIDPVDATVFANAGRLTAVVGQDIPAIETGGLPKVLFV